MKRRTKISIFILRSMTLVLSLLIVHLGIAQNQIERELKSSGGGSVEGNSMRLSYSIGEPVVSTEEGNNFIITQGFEQPFDFVGTVSFTVRVQDASCLGKRNGRAFLEGLGGCQGPYQIAWSAGFNPADSFSTVGLPSGDYSVQVASSDGCSELVNFTIGLIDENPCLLQFYSGVTPNNDGINDSWIIENVDVFPNNKVDIYNRLGNLVWQGVDYDNDNTLWKGQNLRGNDLPSDTYFYVFEANGEVEKGWIELTR